MLELLSRSKGDNHAEPELPGLEPGAEPRAESRSRAAGREFLKALGADLAQAGRRLRRKVRRGGRRARGRPLSESAPLDRPASATRRSLRGLARTLTAALILGMLGVGAMAFWALEELPLASATADASNVAILLESADGQAMGRRGAFRLPDAQREEFADRLIDAVLSIEDRRFYSHWGIDLRAIARAAHRNLAAGQVVEGASTITQQLVKVMMRDNERALARKLREALVAIWLEIRLDKG